MQDANLVPFDAFSVLAKAGARQKNRSSKGQRSALLSERRCGCRFLHSKGQAKLTVVSQKGKEATITLLAAGDFVGEESVGAIAGCRLATATALTACSALKIEQTDMMPVIREEPKFSELFLAFLLTRSMNTQADLVDQLFNSSEKRLARILLLLASSSLYL